MPYSYLLLFILFLFNGISSFYILLSLYHSNSVSKNNNNKNIIITLMDFNIL